MNPDQITKTTKGVVSVFTSPASAVGTQWKPYFVPEWATTIDILCIGGGAAGASGATGAGSNGGSGGGSSGQTKVTVPAHLLPKVLYVSVGAGGRTSGGAGMLSYVSIYPNTTATNVLAVSGNAAATIASGGTIATIANMPLAHMWGQYSMIAGQAGQAANTGAGSSVALPVTGAVCTGGAAGAGTTVSASGGAFTAVTNSFFSLIAPVQATAGKSGSNGFNPIRPFFSFGGCGGGSLNPGTGGAGGKGAWGAGGGGGGAGTVAGGVFGEGGDGYVSITAT